MGFFKEHWKSLLIGAIGVTSGALAFVSYMKWITSTFIIALANLCLAISYPIIDAWQKIQEKKEVVEAKVQGWEEPSKDIETLKTDVSIVKTEILKSNEIKEAKKDKNRILIDLINNNIISTQTLERNILDKRFISVICYQKGFKYSISQKVRDLINKEKKKKKKTIDISREYPPIFEDLGFVELAPPYPYFMIPEENLYPQRLRDLTALSEYLIKKAYISIDSEWNKIKQIHQEKDLDFYNKIKDKTNPLNFNMLIMRINRRDMRQKFILKDDFDKTFNNELSAIIKLNKFVTPETEKVEIRKLISQSSLNILVMSLGKADKKKILALEETFKKSESEGGLGIVNFYDYHKKNKGEIKKILKIKFKDTSKIDQYADLIIKNSQDYREDLLELGVEV